MNRQAFRAAMHEFRSAWRMCCGQPIAPAHMSLQRLDRARRSVPFVCREDRERRLALATEYPTLRPRWARRGQPENTIQRYAQDRIDLQRLLSIRANDHHTPEGKYASPRLVTRDIDILLRRAA